MIARGLTAALAVLGIASAAHAHGIAGNRLFPGTLAIDDPAVADELVMPGFSSFKHEAQGRDATENTLNWSFFRLLTPTLAFGIGSGWIHRNWGDIQRSGFETTTVALKAELYRNDLHETLVSAGIGWGIPHSGARGIDESAPGTIEPGFFFGKGFGDLPDSLAWLRPFAVTGSVVAELPTGARATNFGFDAATGAFVSMPTAKVDTLHWGFSIQYSPLYLTDRFTPGRLPKEEPVNQLVPLVEFAFDSPRGEKTAATMNPGLAYVATSWQFAAEALVPLNREAGHGVGVRAQLLIFLDEFAPKLFGKPLLGR